MNPHPHGNLAPVGRLQVGQWKTWVLASSNDIQVPAPPADTSDQTTAELAELRQLQKQRSPSANTAIQYYHAVPATQRWHDLAHAFARAEKQSLNRRRGWRPFSTRRCTMP